MIDPQSRSLEWIEQASALIPNIADTALVEKALADREIIMPFSAQELLKYTRIPLV